MELYLQRRKVPDEELKNWGPIGPRLSGVKGIHQTYGNAANVVFEDAAARDEARRLTGWEVWDDCALTMRWHEDYVVVRGPDGAETFFGDWGLI